MSSPIASERSLRLSTGLILFLFTTSHLINHSFGIRSVEAMNAAAPWLTKPWQSFAGAIVLYSAFLVHGGLGLWALFRRRQLRMPASEAWQLALGLSIPLLLIQHAGGVRLTPHDVDHGYGRLLYTFFVASADSALPRQLILLTIAWIHGCIGLRAWLRVRAWYPGAAPALASVATLIPVLAVAGLCSAGLDLRDAVQNDPAVAARFAAIAQAAANPDHQAIIDALLVGYIALVAGTIVLRGIRNWHARRYGAVRLTYPDGRVLSVPRGFTVLEASRWAGIPHASICGGRGRCSTCRVRIASGLQTLPEPAPAEARTLIRIGAPADIRLACQIRPTADLAVQPLVRTSEVGDARAARFEAAVQGGREIEIAALFIDLRESTRIASDRLPYDTLFLFDRYIQMVTGAIRDHGGYVTSIAGDGVMSVFGADGDARAAAQGAVKATLRLWDGLAQLNEELAGELRTPLRFGIGVHVGLSVVGHISDQAASLQFLGDTGNLAAKLEGQAKELACTVVISAAALQRAGAPAAAAPGAPAAAAPGALAAATPLLLPGREHPLDAMAFVDRDALAAVVATIGDL